MRKNSALIALRRFVNSRARLVPAGIIFCVHCLGCSRFGTAEFAASTQIVNEAAGTATATVSLSSSQMLSMRIPYTIGGTATCSTTVNTTDDYGCALPSASTLGTLVIPAGSQSASLTFNLFQHLAPKPDRTLLITLGTPENGILGSATTQAITIQGPGPGGPGPGGPGPGPSPSPGGPGGGVTASLSPPGPPICPTTTANVILSLDTGTASGNLVFGLSITPGGPIVDSTDYSVASPGPASLGTPSVNSVTILSGQSSVNLAVVANCGTAQNSGISLTVTPPPGVTVAPNSTVVTF